MIADGRLDRDNLILGYNFCEGQYTSDSLIFLEFAPRPIFCLVNPGLIVYGSMPQGF